MNKTVEDLFCCLAEGRDGLYKPLIMSDEHERKLEKAYKEIGLTLEQQRTLEDIFMDCSCTAERHGFEQGLKLGMRLAIEALNS